MKHSFSTLSILFATLFAAFLFAGCNNTSYEITAITGEESLNGTKFFLFDYIEGKEIDSSVVAKGRLVFKGKADTVRMVALVDEDFSITPSPFFLEPGKIKFNIDSLTVTGTRLNDDLTKFIKDPVVEDYSSQIEELQQMAIIDTDESEQLALVNKYDSLSNLITKHISKSGVECYNNHKNDLLGAFALTIASQGLSFSELDAIMAEASPVITSFQPIAQTYEAMKTMQQTAAGAHYPDIEGTDYATGQPATLGSMIDGKVAVVDFWASWCRPCREEITSTLIPLYNQYKDKGVVVVGIDVSDKPADHDKAVHDLGISYPQLLDSGETAGKLYGITSIPQILIIDRDGIIVARDLRGDAIKTELDKVLAR